jgi:hypothetical protein
VFDGVGPCVAQAASKPALLAATIDREIERIVHLLFVGR